ncbi:class I SAM-dependent methyltransferase [Bacillus sp. FJAT-49736]|uniref:class I SAM-dependent methyltransferase n=1 Tax=Bacillus sp. FJAT-49736 TaxID=2833582 RepID=UPI001BCA0D4F|nr:class I SAM-dependent methyltransferase [Bacillus sp. FJAT-49736]MBS4172841.1 class I SAM-dependent methyltransferase [Bacillus sp. FJAT-49736]
MVLDNFEEYDDPILYDKENDVYIEDIPFLLKWASKSCGNIIDIACGTGRATIPLAQKGFKVIGVDVHKGMLSAAKRKAEAQAIQIEWVEQDCTKLSLKEKAGLIYSVGNSFQHFLTNESQDQLLESVSRNLEMGGTFIFGTRFPSTEELLQPSKEEFWKTYFEEETGIRVDVYTTSFYDSLTQIQHYITIRKWLDESGNILDEKRTNIRLRYVFPKEMERLLGSRGFKIQHVYRNWKEEPLTNDSDQMVYVCRKIRD